MQVCSVCGEVGSRFIRTACNACYLRAWKAGTHKQIPPRQKRLIPRDRKACARCKEVKPLTDYNNDRKRPDGRGVYCRPCVSALWHERKAHNDDYELRRRYGITMAEYLVMHEAQSGRCAICGKPENGKRLAVDHDHETGEVRGLLCQNCNRGLGLFVDNPELLERASAYLRAGVVRNG